SRWRRAGHWERGGAARARAPPRIAAQGFEQSTPALAKRSPLNLREQESGGEGDQEHERDRRRRNPLSCRLRIRNLARRLSQRLRRRLVSRASYCGRLRAIGRRSLAVQRE